MSKDLVKVRARFFSLRARLAFTKLRQAFIKAHILDSFDPEYHIWVETDVSDYIISEVLSHLTLENLD